MPSPASDSPVSRQSSWPAIVRIFVVEILLLLALSAALVSYLSWSSDAAWAEFKSASALSAPNSSLHAVKGHMPCDRKA